MADVTPGTPAATDGVRSATDFVPNYVLNLDIPFLHAKLNDILLNLQQDGDSVMWTQADQGRFSSYLQAIADDLNYLAAQPILDLPKVKGRQYPLEADPDLKTVDNQDVLYVMRVMVALRDEIANSESNRLPNGILPFELTRWLAVITKLQNYMTNYEAKNNPMDLPSSQPETPQAGPGQAGITGGKTTTISVSPV